MNRQRRNTEESVIELQLLASLPTGKKIRQIPDFDEASKKFNAKTEPLDFKNGFAYLPHIDKIVNGATPEGADIIRHEFGNKVDPIHAIASGPQIYDVNLNEQHRAPYEEIRSKGLVPVIGGYTDSQGRPQLEVGTSEPMSDEEAIKRMGTEQEGSYRFDPHSGPGVFFPNPNKTHIKAGQQDKSMAAKKETSDETIARIRKQNSKDTSQKLRNIYEDNTKDKFDEYGKPKIAQLRTRLAELQTKIAGVGTTYGGPENNKEDTDLANKEKNRRLKNPEAPEPTILQKDDLQQKQAAMEGYKVCPDCGGGKNRMNCPTCKGAGQVKQARLHVI